MPSLEEKFDEFRVDALARLVRLETKLDRINAQVEHHAVELSEQKSRLDRAHGAAAIIALIATFVVETVLWLFSAGKYK